MASSEHQSNPRSNGAHNTQPPDGAAQFECNICLDTAAEPVITLCGHLFCWPCIHKWLNQPKELQVCPVCKAGVSAENLIPLYGRGNAKDPRQAKDMPNRPQAQRPEPVRNPNQPNPTMNGFGFMPGVSGAGPFAGPQFGNFSFSAGFGFFPSLFGLQFASFADRAFVSEIDQMTTEQAQAARLSRFLLMLGSFVILCLLLF
eukprot:GILJ01004312.1.p1 GENE.GILJ01004312.1~~GILJ01004312.1.p1  ORF type:complete len:202 (-),score=20.76 GILJ01004312.1:524-1129(-)